MGPIESTYTVCFYLKFICYSFKMKSRQIFIKGLSSSYGFNRETIRSNAARGIHYWWWSFLRLSPVLWYANKTGRTPEDSKTASVCATSGNLFRGDFSNWWDKNSEKLFPESNGRLELVGLRFNELRRHSYSREALYVEIPLDIPMGRIVRDFKSILKSHHLGRSLNPAKASTAEWPLHTMRFRIEVLRREYMTLAYKLLQPEIATWRIADRLQLSPSLRVRETEWKVNQAAYNKLNSISGRYLLKARNTLANAELGSFPNVSQAIKHDSFLPFGKKYNRDFLEATAGNGKGQSAWHRWLRRNHEEDLILEVLEKNKSYFSHTTVDEKDPQFVAFYRGKTDLLP